MTWAKFGTEFADDCAEADLTDAEFRTHVEAYMCLCGIESMDMVIRRTTIRRWAGSDDYAAAVTELVAKGFWERVPDGWRVIHHEDVFRQSLTAQLKKRETDKGRQRSKRRNLADENTDTSSSASCSPIGTDTDTNVGTNTDTNVGTNADTNVGATLTDCLTDSLKEASTASSFDDDLVDDIDPTTGEVIVERRPPQSINSLDEWQAARRAQA